MIKSRLGWMLGSAMALGAGLVGCGAAPVGPEPALSGVGGNVSDPLCAGMLDASGKRISTGSGGSVGTAPGLPVGTSFSQFPPQLGLTTTQSVAPPAISGGTLRVLADGRTAVAADPDRDRIYVVDLTNRTKLFDIALTAGDEPGRVVGDTANRAHIALRRGGAVVSINPATGTILERRSVCAAPRGIAHDPGSDLLHVACADGQLVSLPAAGGPAVRTLNLDRDLRDVVVDGARLLVSRFRSAEILTVEATGAVPLRQKMPAFRSSSVRSGQLYTAGVAWRMMGMPDGGVMMLHQRGVIDEVQPVVGGYGGFDTCGSIVHPAVTTVAPDGTARSGPALAGLVLAVDMAISADGQQVAFVSSGNASNTFNGDTTGTPQLPRVFMSTVDATTDPAMGCRPDGMHGPCPGGSFRMDQTLLATSDGAAADPAGSAPLPPNTMTGTGGVAGTGGAIPPPPPGACGNDPAVPQVVGEPIAVAFAGDGTLVVQSREPAMLALPGGARIELSAISRRDTGHLVFHANSGGSLACASCHAEGNDDGRTWNFTCEGPRRTQSMHVGLRGTEPFHWGGDQLDINRLMEDVFVGRMSGPLLAPDQSDALLTWIDTQPRPLRTAPSDLGAVERGRAIFHDGQHAACGSCHSGGRFTNAQTVDVGTGGPLQVPSLVGIGSRGPFMHNGCAKTLRDRFNPACGGGDRHGITSDLTEGQLSDLIAYLESI